MLYRKKQLESFVVGTFVGIWIGVLEMLYLLNSHSQGSSEQTIYTIQINYSRNVDPLNHNDTVRSMSESDACVLPNTPIWPEYFKKWDPNHSAQDCSYEKKLAVLKGTQLSKLPGKTILSCCLYEVLRWKRDSSYNISQCEPFNGTVQTEEKEAFIVECGKFLNAFANIPIKPKVQEKLDFWEAFSDLDKPYNVLILGIDTMSRSHAYRSLPKTMRQLQELGFHDFRGFHSLAPSTLPNFLGMLTGLSHREVRGSCAKNWASPFDNCPFIWKSFSENNYVTGYLEDGAQSFNWGGQSGFKRQPTDYYLHHLFLYLRKIRREKNSQRNLSRLSSLDCVSDETVSTFMLQYNQRWLKKFRNTPFFLMNWFEDPFHEDINALPNFDRSLSHFFKYLSLQWNLLRKSLIIFVSDHGDKMNQFFNGKSIESFFERVRPALFIRLPDQLQVEHPEILKNFKDNSPKLITPFDIHQSLLHLMGLSSNLNLASEKLHPRMRNRSSLLEIVPTDRTCESVNIPSTHCLCNLKFNNTQNKHIAVRSNLTNDMLSFAVEHLNEKILRHNSSAVCSKWMSWPNNVTYARYIRKSESYNEAVLVFVAFPGKAKFEARLKFPPKFKEGEVFSRTAQLVGFSRLNKYGDHSWCLPTLTDADKEMKEFCTCRTVKRV